MQRLFDGTEEERMQARGQNRFESEFADGLRFADHQGPQKKKGTRAKSLLTFTLADFWLRTLQDKLSKRKRSSGKTTCTSRFGWASSTASWNGATWRNFRPSTSTTIAFKSCFQGKKACGRRSKSTPSSTSPKKPSTSRLRSWPKTKKVKRLFYFVLITLSASKTASQKERRVHAKAGEEGARIQ